MLIRNGTIVTPIGTKQGNILVSGEKIAAIYDLSHPIEGDAHQVIDAAGCYIFPGGIDPHVHMHLPTSAGYSSDDFRSGSRAALFGGTTTLIDFVTPRKKQSLTSALAERRKEASNILTDYSLHVSPIEWRDSIPHEIEACAEAGITSFKVYMAYKDAIGIDDDVLEKVMKAVADAGGMVMVHCELGDEIERMRDALVASGQTGVMAHALSRPDEMESHAVQVAIRLAAKTGCRLYIVHVSTKESVTHIRRARQNGQKVYAEVCPHHLLLDLSGYDQPFDQAAPYVLSPPLRAKADQEALWKGLADNTIQVVGTDHCPFMMTQKKGGLHDFRLIANGAGGVEHRLELLYTYGVKTQRISLERFVEVTAASPAKIFGLYPKKGTIETGSDADLVVWNPGATHTISHRTHHQNCDHNIYEGFEVQGQPAYVIFKGEAVIQNGEMINAPSGRFMPRTAP